MCLHRKSTHFKFTYVLFHATLRPKWRQFLLAEHAKVKHASRRAACGQSMNAFCGGANLLRRVREESVCAYVGSGRRSSSTDLTFSRPVNQQTLRTPREKANEGEKMIREELCVLCEGGMNDSSVYTLSVLGWMWIFDTQQSIEKASKRCWQLCNYITVCQMTQYALMFHDLTQKWHTCNDKTLWFKFDALKSF